MTYVLTLKPQAPGLTRPQRILLKIDGERIVDVEYRPDTATETALTHAAQFAPAQLIAAAAQSAPGCGVAHGLALCQAIELLAGIEVPPRAAFLRVAAAELERASSHGAAVAAILTTLGLANFAEPFTTTAARLQATLITLTATEPGDWLIPGGVGYDSDASVREVIEQTSAELIATLFPLVERVLNQRSLLARTVDVGIITTHAATQFRLEGPLGRASGLTNDRRIDKPYAAYPSLPPELVTQPSGDVYARLVVLVLELLESLKLVGRASRELPGGEICGELPERLPASTTNATVEGARGPITYHVESDGRRLTSVSYKLAPQVERLLTRSLLVNARIDDAALVFVSTDPCDTCLETGY